MAGLQRRGGNGRCPALAAMQLSAGWQRLAVLSIFIGGGHDDGGNYKVVDDTQAGQGATLLLDYNTVEGTDAALPHFAMRKRI